VFGFKPWGRAEIGGGCHLSCVGQSIEVLLCNVNKFLSIWVSYRVPEEHLNSALNMPCSSSLFMLAIICSCQITTCGTAKSAFRREMPSSCL